MRRYLKWIVPAVLLLAAAFVIYKKALPKKQYTARDFGITTAVSAVDFDGDGTDDYRDIMLGARMDAENHPTYDGSYQAGGYPPDDIGVCTDVVWRAFKNAGYCLKDMVDADIAARPEAYTKITKPDPNIDFRRVINLRVFFDTYAVSLTLDINDHAAWQPGDIVIFGADKHIGIISDIRNKDGRAWVIHNGGQSEREEDALGRSQVTGHYRFDASLIPPGVLRAWTDQ